MSSTNDTYHHLLVQTQPKGILKKSPSPKFLDSTINSENDYYSNTCILNDNQSVKKDNSDLSSIEVPLDKLIMTSNGNSSQYEIDNQLIRTYPPADLSSSLTSDDEQQQQQHVRLKLKTKCYRPFVTTGTLSSSSDNIDERKAKQSMEESKTTLIRSKKHRQKDMQLDEFMRKYQQQGGIPIPTPKEDHDKTKHPINHHRNNYHQ